MLHGCHHIVLQLEAWCILVNLRLVRCHLRQFIVTLHILLDLRLVVLIRTCGKTML